MSCYFPRCYHPIQEIHSLSPRKQKYILGDNGNFYFQLNYPDFLKREIMQELQIVFIMGHKRKWEFKGKQTHRTQNKRKLLCPAALPERCEQLHKLASVPTSQESKRPFLSFVRDHILTQKPYPKAGIQKTFSRKEFPQQFFILVSSFQNRIIILSVYIHVCMHSFFSAQGWLGSGTTAMMPNLLINQTVLLFAFSSQLFMMHNTEEKLCEWLCIVMF